MTRPSRVWIKITSDGRFAYDSYRRFIQLWEIALGVEEKEFNQILSRTKEKCEPKKIPILMRTASDLCKEYYFRRERNVLSRKINGSIKTRIEGSV